jgi:outer membrane protein assembly factor BamB
MKSCDAWRGVAACALIGLAACSGDDGNGTGGNVDGIGSAGMSAGSPGGAGGTPASGGTGMPSAGTGAGPAGSGAGTGGAPPTGGGGGMGPSAGEGGTGGSDPGGGGAPAGTWPQLGYDEKSWYFNPTETAITVENAASLMHKWSFPVAGYPAGGVTIAEGKVFATATGGVYAIDLETGTMVWARTDINSQSTAAYHDGHVYVHTYNPGANLFKLNASDGTTVWGGDFKTYDHPGSDGTSSPTIADGKVFVGHSSPNEITASGTQQTETRGGVAAFDLETGMKAWHYFTVELPENGAMVWSTVTVDVTTGDVFASTGNNYTVAGDKSDAIHAIDLTSGMYKWHSQVRAGDTWVLSGFATNTGDDTDFGANPIIATIGGKRVVAAADKGSAFWALDADTGDVLWSRDDLSASHFAANGGVLNNGAFDGTYFYVVSNDPTASSAVLHALDPAQNGADAWPPLTVQKITWGMPSVANGVLFVPMDDDLLILNAHTGERLHMFNTGGSIAAGPAAIAGGKVVVKSGLSYPLGSAKNNNQVHCYGLP